MAFGFSVWCCCWAPGHLPSEHGSRRASSRHAGFLLHLLKHFFLDRTSPGTCSWYRRALFVTGWKKDRLVCSLRTETVYSLLAKWILRACEDKAVSHQLLCLLSKFYVSPKQKKKLVAPALATGKQNKTKPINKTRKGFICAKFRTLKSTPLQPGV